MSAETRILTDSNYLPKLNAMEDMDIDMFFGHLGSFILDGNFDKLELTFNRETDILTFKYSVEGVDLVGHVQVVDEGPSTYINSGDTSKIVE